MVTASSSAETRISAPDLWQILIDPSRIPDWNTLHNEFVGDVPEQLRAGEGYTQRVKLMGMAVTVSWVVKELREPEMMELVGSGPAGLTITTTYEVRPTAAGASVTLKSVFSGGPVETPFAPNIERLAQSTGDQSVARISALRI